MFACSELVTGVDDFGKVIFLQSNCERAYSRRERASEEFCPSCGQRLSVCQQNDNGKDKFNRLLSALLEQSGPSSGSYQSR
ncbi:MAG: hypothetical protein AcusKO_31370 [Acuticoccus sp.]